ncbi:AMP-binding protein [Mycolicibacterium goodii]|uniref:AMP-binding protein n=1 Tax=Mycolicibacterium goodii TaxID=134601 RepID=UPI001BDBF053|nr:AMP-binding protein [Mycolicibacterium goodii]MBU8808184.1 AMP-binding protein [Mycolicibacterium goodii]
MTQSRTLGALVSERARTHRNSVFVTVENRSVTYHEFDALVTRAARGLLSMGVSYGDRVCLALPNSLEFLAASFGLMRLGAIQVPLNLEFRSAQVAYVLTDADATALICTPNFVAEHRDTLAQARLDTVLMTSDDPAGDANLKTRSWSDVLAAGDRGVESFPEVSPADPLAIMYTSGTTGDPKGVQLCHEHELTIAENIAASVALSDADCFYNFYPLHHNTGLGIITGAVLVAGARMLLIDRFSQSRFWPDVVQHGCTAFYGMGPILEILDKDQSADVKSAGHKIRVCFGIAISDDQAERFRKRFGVDFVSGYGSTEVNMVAIAPMLRGHPGAAGKVLDDFEVAIVDGDDHQLPLGQVGEIVVRPRRPYITSLGYFRKPAETAAAWRNLWAHTGDAGRLDADGYLYFVDRIKDVIRHRGNNISSVEVETPILALSEIAEVAVIPVPSELGEFDQDICAVIVPRADARLTAADVIAWCDKVLPRYAVPRYIEFVAELPKTATGKVRKNVLRHAPASAARWDREKHVARVNRATGKAG